MSIRQEMERRKRDQMSTAPWKEGDISVYSPYTDRRLWINPEYVKKYGGWKEAVDFVLQRDKQGAEMCGKIGNMVSDIGMISEIEMGLTNDKE